MARLDGPDQLGHAKGGDVAVLELVAAGADGDVEPGKIGLVVDGDPVVADVVEIDHAFLLVGNAEAGEPAWPDAEPGLAMAGR